MMHDRPRSEGDNRIVDALAEAEFGASLVAQQGRVEVFVQDPKKKQPRAPGDDDTYDLKRLIATRA